MAQGVKALKRFLLSKSTLAEERTIPQSLLWLLAGRVIVVAVWLLVIYLTDKNSPNPTSPISFWLVSAGTLSFSMANWIAIKKVKAYGACYLHFFVDIFLISSLVVISNGVVGVLPYLLVVIAAATILGTHGAVSVAALSAISFSLSITVFYNSVSSLDVFLNIVGLTTAALLISFLTSKYEALDKHVSQQARNILTLSRQRKEILENVPDGVITLDIESSITGINKAASAILGLANPEENNFLGTRIDEFLRERGVEQPERVLLATNSNSSGSLSLNLDQDNIVALNYKVSSLSSEGNTEGGKLLVLRDVSKVQEMESALSIHEQMEELLDQVEDKTVSVLDETSDLLASVKMVGESNAIKKIRTLVERVARSTAAVLIMGESGTGKELIAQLTHDLSPRSEEAFVAINCGAIPENLIESQLFGHKKGSFTGADKDHLGLLEQADRGTVFLDEVGELPLHLQTKLLRALQEKTIRPVGANEDKKVDIRVLSATNRDLKREVENRNFREDLYYRLNVISIYAPPLRERKEDIPLLVNYFVAKSSNEHNPVPKISPEVIRLLMKYRFPGNIRELQNIVERALVLGGRAITANHLPEEVQKGVENNPVKNSQLTPTFPIELEAELENIEKTWINLALEEADGVKTKAADLLGLNFRSLRYRLKKYELGE